MRTPTTPETAHVGQFIDARLVTDTEVWEIIGKTAKTITIRDCRPVMDGNGYGLHLGTWPHLEYAVQSNPGAITRVLRLRKDGTFRMARWARPFYPAVEREFPDGKTYPVEYRDWSF
jgi:hypothetical protein